MTAAEGASYVERDVESDRRAWGSGQGTVTVDCEAVHRTIG